MRPYFAGLAALEGRPVVVIHGVADQSHPGRQRLTCLPWIEHGEEGLPHRLCGFRLIAQHLGQIVWVLLVHFRRAVEFDGTHLGYPIVR